MEFRVCAFNQSVVRGLFFDAHDVVELHSNATRDTEYSEEWWINNRTNDDGGRDQACGLFFQLLWSLHILFLDGRSNL